MRRIVDVFTGAAKVHEFTGSGQFFIVGNLFLNPVLNRFHIVVGWFFNILDFLAGLNGEISTSPRR